MLIPGENDSEEELKQLTSWITDNLSDEVPLHFTAFHPDFKLTDKSRTPLQTLKDAANLAKQAGIKYIYLGNNALEQLGVISRDSSELTLLRLIDKPLQLLGNDY